MTFIFLNLIIRNDSEVLNGTGSASYPDRQNPDPSIATTTNRRESDTSLPTIFLGASTESNSNDDEDNNPDRRNSASDRRRGSKLLDIFDGRNKKSPKRYKDKQGKKKVLFLALSRHENFKISWPKKMNQFHGFF